MRAKRRTGGRITLAKGSADRLSPDARSMLDFELLADDTMVARAVTADPRRIRGVLCSPLAKALSIEDIDTAIGAAMQGEAAVTICATAR